MGAVQGDLLDKRHQPFNAGRIQLLGMGVYEDSKASTLPEPNAAEAEAGDKGSD